MNAEIKNIYTEQGTNAGNLNLKDAPWRDRDEVIAALKGNEWEQKLNRDFTRYIYTPKKSSNSPEIGLIVDGRDSGSNKFKVTEFVFMPRGNAVPEIDGIKGEKVKLGIKYNINDLEAFLEGWSKSLNPAPETGAQPEQTIELDKIAGDSNPSDTLILPENFLGDELTFETVKFNDAALPEEGGDLVEPVANSNASSVALDQQPVDKQTQQIANINGCSDDDLKKVEEIIDQTYEEVSQKTLVPVVKQVPSSAPVRTGKNWGQIATGVLAGAVAGTAARWAMLSLFKMAAVSTTLAGGATTASGLAALAAPALAICAAGGVAGMASELLVSKLAKREPNYKRAFAFGAFGGLLGATVLEFFWPSEVQASGAQEVQKLVEATPAAEPAVEQQNTAVAETMSAVTEPAVAPSPAVVGESVIPQNPPVASSAPPPVEAVPTTADISAHDYIWGTEHRVNLADYLREHGSSIEELRKSAAGLNGKGGQYIRDLLAVVDKHNGQVSPGALVTLTHGCRLTEVAAAAVNDSLQKYGPSVLFEELKLGEQVLADRAIQLSVSDIQAAKDALHPLKVLESDRYAWAIKRAVGLHP